MLKGFFYRRTPENNQLATETHIRFEINSKESFLAKVTNLGQEGIQFTLSRGKVILVPDERIMLILNSPEHGEFKISGDVYYFCNLTESNDPQVCYGIKFFELSVLTWEVIVDFCGRYLPDITFLTPDNTIQKYEKAPEQSIISIKPAVKPVAAVPAKVDTKNVFSAAPFPSFPQLPPIIPVNTPPIIPNIVAELHPAEKLVQPVEQPKTELNIPVASLPAKTELNIPVASLPAKIELKAPTVPAAFTFQPQAEPTFDRINAYQAFSSATDSQVNEKDKPFQPEQNSLSSIAPAPVDLAATTEVAASKPDLSQIPPAAVVKPYPASNDNSKTIPTPSPIQALAVSLAASPTPHTQPKALSLSQEMIDRLVEKLQSETVEEPTVESPSIASTPNFAGLPTDTFNLNTASQNSTDQTPGISGQTKPIELSIPFTLPKSTHGMASETKDNQLENLQKPETKSPEIKWPVENHVSDPAPFDPFASLNIKPDITNQPEIPANPPGQSENGILSKAAPFDPFAQFNLQSGKTQQSGPKNNEPIPDHAKSLIPNVSLGEFPEKPPVSFATTGEISLGNLMNNLDLTINKNTMGQNNTLQPETVTEVKPELQTTAKLSLNDLNNIDLPYSNHETGDNIDNVPKKAPVAATEDIVALPKQPAINVANPLPAEKTSTPFRATIGPAILPNAPGVSLDQKAIDKLVDSLIQDMAADEPAPDIQPNQAKSVPLGNGMSNTEGILHSSNKELNTYGANLTNTVIPLSEAEQPAPANVKPFAETKRTLDQKAIDQVVQALTQNISATNNFTPATTGTSIPFNNNLSVSFGSKPTENPDKKTDATFSLNSLSASLRLENGEVLRAIVEQIYVGGLIVAIECDLPLNSSVKINLAGNNIRITDVLGTCTNCETAPAGKPGYQAEIFFKNMSNSHMEQFRALIARVDAH